MHFCQSVIRRAIWTIGLLLWGIVYCHAYHFQSTSAYRNTGTEYKQRAGFNAPNARGRVADFPTPITATYQGGFIEKAASKSIGDRLTIYEPFTPNNPSDNNNPANNGGTSNDEEDEEEVIPGTPSDPRPPTEYPIGEPWIMLLFAAILWAVTGSRRVHNMTSISNR